MCRLLPAPQRRAAREAGQIFSGTVLLTGGLGSLGLLVAIWLAQQQQQVGDADSHRDLCLVLLGRTGRAGSAALASLLAHIGTGSVTLSRCDVSSAEEAGSLIQQCRPVRNQLQSCHLPAESSLFWSHC